MIKPDNDHGHNEVQLNSGGCRALNYLKSRNNHKFTVNFVNRRSNERLFEIISEKEVSNRAFSII